MRRGHLIRGWRIVAAVMVVGVFLAPVVGVPTAQAEDVITSQPFVSAMGLDGLKAQGFDGSGVTIAVIDGVIDTTVPELAGADIEVKAACTSKGAFHGTAMISDLADPIWGWAPKAHFLVYGADGLVGDAYEDTTSGCGGGEDDMVQRAISDGADIINISASLVVGPYTMARAAMRGVPIVTGSGNFGQYGDGVDSPYNAVVIVGATDMSGQRSEYSQYGQGLTVVAPADPSTYRLPDDQGDLTRIVSLSEGGTSTATAMVTGVLALAMQKWPEANGNQLIASLIATSDRAGQWDEFYGWGLVNAAGLISNDPSQYSTENPLMDAIPGAEPTRQDYEDYVNGTVEFSSSISPYDTDYTPAPTAGPTPSTTTSGGVASWVVPVCVGVVVVIAGVVVVLIVVSRRRRATAPAAPALVASSGSYPAQAYATVPPQGYPPSGPPPGYPQSGPPSGYPTSPPGFGYPQGSPPGYGYPQGYPQGVPSQQPPVQPPPGWVPPSSSYPGGPYA